MVEEMITAVAGGFTLIYPASARDILKKRYWQEEKKTKLPVKLENAINNMVKKSYSIREIIEVITDLMVQGEVNKAIAAVKKLKETGIQFEWVAVEMVKVHVPETYEALRDEIFMIGYELPKHEFEEIMINPLKSLK